MTEQPKPKATFRAMTPDEQALARALRGSIFSGMQLDNFDRRFAEDIRRRAEQRAPQISEKQAAMLRQLVTKYRAKVRPDDIPAAEKPLLEQPKKSTRAPAATSRKATADELLVKLRERLGPRGSVTLHAPPPADRLAPPIRISWVRNYGDRSCSAEGTTLVEALQAAIACEDRWAAGDARGEG